MYIGGGSSDTYPYSGLFGYITARDGKTVSIRNLTIASGEVRGGGTNESYTGSIVGYGSCNPNGEIRITDCTNRATVTGGTLFSSSFAITSCTGGLMGRVNGSGTLQMEGCTNEKEVTGGDAESSASSAQSYTGGILGYGNSSGFITVEFAGCINKGIVKGGKATSTSSFPATSSTGGIAGYIISANLTLTGCRNQKAITAGETEATASTGYLYTGGLLGVADGTMDIQNCSNRGDITGGTDRGSRDSYQFTGGLAGDIASPSLILSNSYSNSLVTAPSGYAGGLAGLIVTDPGSTSASITDCYAAGEFVAGNAGGKPSYTGGLIGVLGRFNTTTTVPQLQNCIALFDRLDGETAHRITGLTGITYDVYNYTEDTSTPASDYFGTGNHAYIPGMSKKTDPAEAVDRDGANWDGMLPGEWNAYQGWDNTAGYLPYSSGDEDIKVPIPTGYTLTLDANGGILANGQQQQEPVITAYPFLDRTLKDPSYTGHTFEGWYTAKTGGEKWDNDKEVTTDTELFARWQKNDVPAIYHTITLVVDSGIQLYNQSPGPLVVEDGGHLYLQFLPESPDLTANDLVLTINGTDTPFKDFGSNHYYTYILNPVDKDYEIHIALRDNTVGNAAVHAGKASVVVESGQLIVDSAHPVDVAVYSITGQSVVFVRALNGTKIFDLPAGIYIVRAGTTTEKIVIND